MRRTQRNSNAPFLEGFFLVLFVFVFSSFFLSGCTPPSKKDKGADTKKEERKEDGRKQQTPEHWRALADLIDSQELRSSSYLVATMEMLAKTGKITKEDVAAFDKAFEGITKKERLLTKEDAETLRGLK